MFFIWNGLKWSVFFLLDGLLNMRVSSFFVTD